MTGEDYTTLSLVSLSQTGARYGLYPYPGETPESFAHRIMLAMNEREKEQQRSKYIAIGVRVAISIALAAVGATWF